MGSLRKCDLRRFVEIHLKTFLVAQNLKHFLFFLITLTIIFTRYHIKSNSYFFYINIIYTRN